MWWEVEVLAGPQDAFDLCIVRMIKSRVLLSVNSTVDAAHPLSVNHKANTNTNEYHHHVSSIGHSYLPCVAQQLQKSKNNEGNCEIEEVAIALLTWWAKTLLIHERIVLRPKYKCDSPLLFSEEFSNSTPFLWWHSWICITARLFLGVASV